MTIYSLDVLLSQFGTSLLFHVQFQLLFLDWHTHFSGGRSGGLVFSSLKEFSTVCCDPHSQRLWRSQYSKSRCFPELSCFFNDPVDVGNLISGSSAFSKSSLNIWKFTVHILDELLKNLKTDSWYIAKVLQLFGTVSIQFTAKNNSLSQTSLNFKKALPIFHKMGIIQVASLSVEGN